MRLVSRIITAIARAAYRETSISRRAKMSRPLRAFFCVVVGFVSLLAGKPASAQDVIKIGATAALTGPYANVYGVQGKIWDAWTQAINDRGGIYVKSLDKKLPVKIVYYDDQGDPKT